MKNTLSPIIQSFELLEILKNENLFLIDASNTKDAKSNYLIQHIEGAIFIDINTQLADIKDDLSNGGRHPLPSIENFISVLNQNGISPNHHIVIYDTFNGYNAAARLWWMLKSIGHVNVQILNGGFKEAVKVGIPVNSNIKILIRTQLYKAQDWLLPLATIEEVEDASINNSKTIIDVREEKRYNGEIEPIDLIAGHIPNAVNIPFTENLDCEGLILPQTILKEKYLEILKNIKSDDIIVHCGSGVTACFTLLVMAFAGLEMPKLYVGSWSEWSRNDKPIETNL